MRRLVDQVLVVMIGSRHLDQVRSRSCGSRVISGRRVVMMRVMPVRVASGVV